MKKKQAIRGQDKATAPKCLITINLIKIHRSFVFFSSEEDEKKTSHEYEQEMMSCTSSDDQSDRMFWQNFDDSNDIMNAVTGGCDFESNSDQEMMPDLIHNDSGSSDEESADEHHKSDEHDLMQTDSDYEDEAKCKAWHDLLHMSDEAAARERRCTHKDSEHSAMLPDMWSSTAAVSRGRGVGTVRGTSRIPYKGPAFTACKETGSCTLTVPTRRPAQARCGEQVEEQESHNSNSVNRPRASTSRSQQHSAEAASDHRTNRLRENIILSLEQMESKS